MSNGTGNNETSSSTQRRRRKCKTPTSKAPKDKESELLALRCRTSKESGENHHDIQEDHKECAGPVDFGEEHEVEEQQRRSKEPVDVPSIVERSGADKDDSKVASHRVVCVEGEDHYPRNQISNQSTGTNS